MFLRMSKIYDNFIISGMPLFHRSEDFHVFAFAVGSRFIILLVLGAPPVAERLCAQKWLTGDVGLNSRSRLSIKPLGGRNSWFSS